MPRGRVGWKRTIRAIIFRTVKSRTLGLLMLHGRDAGGAHGTRAGPNPLAVPTVHGGRERGDDNLAPLGGGVHRVLLGHERLLRGSTATRHRASNPFVDEITKQASIPAASRASRNTFDNGQRATSSLPRRRWCGVGHRCSFELRRHRPISARGLETVARGPTCAVHSPRGNLLKRFDGRLRIMVCRAVLPIPSWAAPADLLPFVPSSALAM